MLWITTREWVLWMPFTGRLFTFFSVEKKKKEVKAGKKEDIKYFKRGLQQSPGRHPKSG